MPWHHRIHWYLLVKDSSWSVCCFLLMNFFTCFFFSSAHIPLYLYPFLNTTSKSRPFEYLRLTSLGVIGALVKVLLPYSFWCWVLLTALWTTFQTTFLLQYFSTTTKNCTKFITKSLTRIFTMERKSNLFDEFRTMAGEPIKSLQLFTTTTTKPYPTMLGWLHGPNYAIVFYKNNVLAHI